MNCIDITTTIMTWSGTFIGLASLLVSIVVAIRTKRVEEAVKNQVEILNRKYNYKIKQRSLYDRLCVVERQFAGDDRVSVRKELINECDMILSELEGCIPRTDAITLIVRARKALTEINFTPIMIMTDIHDIITILSEEEL